MSERNIIVTLECFINKDGKYLMLHRNADKRILPNVWLAPGGKREHNEGLFECTRREVKEETGLDIKNLRVMCVGNGYMKDIDQEVFFNFVHADYAGGEVLENPPDGELRWVTPEEMVQLPNILAELPRVMPLLLQPNAPVLTYKCVYDGNTLLEFEIEEV